MEMSQRVFEVLEDSQEEVIAYQLQNDYGMSVEILSYAGMIRKICVPDKNGKMIDVVLGHDRVQGGYRSPYPFPAAVIGRFANRIRNAEFSIDDSVYHLDKNENNCCLHGGFQGYQMQNFHGELSGGENCVSLILKYTDRGLGGFPGTVEVKVLYELFQNNELSITYQAVPTDDTVMNLTNHVFFNLNGHESGSMADHVLQVNADFYTPNDDECIPTGEVLAVKDTAFDFTRPKKLGNALYSDDPQIQLFHGIDHNFCLRGRGYREALKAVGNQSGVMLSIKTDLPGAQIYTTNAPQPQDFRFKDGAKYQQYQGFCFETQHFPDSPNLSHFPSPIIRAGQQFATKTSFAFSVQKN